jgi:hypothetical protein
MPARVEVDVVEPCTQAGPATGRAAERTSGRNVQGRVVCRREYFRFGFVNAALVLPSPRLERKHSQALSFAGKRQRDAGGAGADDADVVGDIFDRCLRQHGHGRPPTSQPSVEAMTDGTPASTGAGVLAAGCRMYNED